MNTSRSCLGCAALAAAFLVLGPAHGHEVRLPVSGRSLTIRTAAGPAKQRVRFVTRGEPVALGIRHDPRTSPTWLLFRGEGVSAGGSGRIDLDPTLWRPIGGGGRIRGYRYIDEDATRGGIRRIVYRSGRLAVYGRGPNWSWQPDGAVGAVWVHFGIEDESVCARFGGDVRRSGAGLFKAADASRPNACPASLCGNGIVELGEACDDGNLVADDGCSASCQLSDCTGPQFDSTFAAIQELIFDGQGCTNSICHGADPGQGGLNLSQGVSYSRLLDVPATGSSYRRIQPAKPRESALYLKLLKAVDPNATDIAGDAMPTGLPPIPANLLEALRLWIEGAAPEASTVVGTESLLGGCFPDPVPVSILPLEPPDPNVGVHLEMPAVHLDPQSETEVCFAAYYDFSAVVPDRFKDPNGKFFYSNGDITRQDPHSHHLVILDSGLRAADVHDPSYGAWTCSGGPRDGLGCDPLVLDDCGEGGLCHAEIVTNTACIGYGPPGGSFAGEARAAIGGAGNGQASLDLAPGQFRKIPLKMIIYWNAHAFNLTGLPHELKAYLNLFFTDDAREEVEQFFDFRHIYVAAGQPPYTRRTYCRNHTFAQGTRVIQLSSHQHERGEAFWINDPDGNTIYESFTYGDPLVKVYSPPLAFDDPDPARRTIEFCGTFSNGLDPDGSPNPDKVRRLSFTPPNAFPCQPTACTQGRVAAACGGPSDHVTCDSSPGAGDGLCDACAITAGVSTQDEMFVLTGWKSKP
ncbi:MAG: myxococcus cysteine-rich repeat containing protein [Myxococcota bacterium]